MAETTGAWGSEAHKVMSQLISLSFQKLEKLSRSQSMEEFINANLEEFIFALAKSVAEQLIGAFGPYIY